MRRPCVECGAELEVDGGDDAPLCGTSCLIMGIEREAKIKLIRDNIANELGRLRYYANTRPSSESIPIIRAYLAWLSWECCDIVALIGRKALDEESGYISLEVVYCGAE